ncbi:hypothetical protein GCM10018980_51530 [Streptomyces capoamus]|uniref:Uncharacterized protein n=1 Tax=Streptomyces capoamus TaxID=68183 RepID=A0A919EZM5_9ACTN|nr:hypothetical protein [Streptomyces capoamus]GGW15793.1 hypothetical protein GCM10010501_29280 [Streptomyces libani subsp. rufus]GHG61968.1 hypothetical protein GCM10018980_51530 [Streptomyces capoamus]
MTGPGRYHLTLAAGGRTMMHGWWSDEQTARRKFARCIGEYGSMPGARVTLTDEETGTVLTTWPEEP